MKRCRLSHPLAAAALALVGLSCAATSSAPDPDGQQPAAGGSLPEVRRLERPGWVEVRAEILASDAESPSLARARALGTARAAAVEHVAGVRVQSALIDLEQIQGSDASSLVQVLTAARADALVVDERLVESRMTPLPDGGYRLAVTLRARVLDRSDARDPGFRAEVKLDRERFLDGDEVILSVRASRNARIYVLKVTPAGAALLIPNAHLRDTRVAAREWLRFPDRELRRRGVKLVARVPEGYTASRELLLVLALRGDEALDEPLPAQGEIFVSTDARGAGGLFAELMAPLLELPPDAWTFDQVAYEVLAR